MTWSWWALNLIERRILAPWVVFTIKRLNNNNLCCFENIEILFLFSQYLLPTMQSSLHRYFNIIIISKETNNFKMNSLEIITVTTIIILKVMSLYPLFIFSPTEPQLNRRALFQHPWESPTAPPWFQPKSVAVNKSRRSWKDSVLMTQQSGHQVLGLDAEHKSDISINILG